MTGILKKFRRVTALFLSMLLIVNLIPASALAEDGWTYYGDIRYKVEKCRMDDREEITVMAISDSPATELLGIKLPDDSFIEAQGQEVVASYTALVDGDYDFQILSRHNDVATGSEAATSSNAEKASVSDAEIASPSDTKKVQTTPSNATVSEADGVTYDEDGEVYVEDWEIGTDYSMSTREAEIMLMSVEVETDGDIEEVDTLTVGVSVAGLEDNIAITLEWQDKTGKKLDDTYTEKSGTEDYDMPYLFLNFGLGGNKTYAAEELKIVIPDGSYLCPDKNGGMYTGTCVWIPTGISGFSKIAESRASLYGAEWAAYKDGNDLILVNDTAIAAGNYSLGVRLRYDAVGSAPNSVSDMASRELKALVYDGDACVQTSNELTYVYDSRSYLSISGDAEAWYKWNTEWGEEPKEYPSQNYVYGYYRFGVSDYYSDRNKKTYQHTLLSDMTYSEEDNIIGYRISKISDEFKDISCFENDVTNLIGMRVNDIDIEFIVAYDRPQNDTIKGSLKLIVVGIPADGYDSKLSSNRSGSVSFTTFSHERDGHLFSKTVVDSNPDETALFQLNNGESVSEPFKISGNIYCYDMRETYGNLHFMLSDDQPVKLDGEELIYGTDYELDASNRQIYYQAYEEDKYGNITLSEKTYIDCEYTDTGLKWQIDDVAFDYVCINNMWVTVTLYPTDHVKEIIKGKDTVYLYNEASLSLKNDVGEELIIDGTDYDQKILMGDFYSLPSTEFNDNLGNYSYDDDYAHGNVEIRIYCGLSANVPEYALNENKVYFILPKFMEIEFDHTSVYANTDCYGIHLYNSKTYGRGIDCYADNCQVEYLGETDGGKLYFLDVEPYIQGEELYSLKVGIPYKYPLEAIRHYDDSPIVKAAWMRTDGEDIYFNTTNPGVLYGHDAWNGSTPYSSFTDGFIPTNDNDLGAVYIAPNKNDILYDFSVFENLDSNGEADQISVNQKKIIFTDYNPSVFSSSFSKSVMGNTDSSYTSTTITEVGSEYRYRLKLSNSESSQRRNIIMYDNLEQGYGNNPHWNGTFLYVDTAECQIHDGCNPTVYYSTKEGLSSDAVPTIDELTGSDTWITKYPEDPSKVTAIAVDFGDYILNEKESVYVDIIMQAPSQMMTDNGKALYAYNETLYCAEGKMSTDTEWTPILTQNANLVKVQLTCPLNAGKGMKLTWTESNVKDKSVYSSAKIRFPDLPDDTNICIYDLSDCELTEEGWYVPKAGAVMVGSVVSLRYGGMLHFGDQYVQTNSVVLNGSIETETDAVGASYTREYVLYVAEGDLSDLDFTVDIEVTAWQYRNNKPDNLAGFFNTINVQFLVEDK